MKLYVQYKKITLSEKHSEEQYGDWSASYDFEVVGVYASPEDRLSRKHNQEEFNVPFEVKPGDPVFVLYMIYSSGDSFGFSDGNGEILWVFKDPDIARKFENLESLYLDTFLVNP